MGQLMNTPAAPRFALDLPLPPYSYVSGKWPHPIRDPSGHMYGRVHGPATLLLNADDLHRSTDRQQSPEWLYALDLFNHGFYWESHEQWENAWNSFGRTTRSAAFTKGLIHLAAACVKAREGRTEGVSRHTTRANELLMSALMNAREERAVLGISAASIRAVLAELGGYVPSPEHTSNQPVVRVIKTELRPA